MKFKRKTKERENKDYNYYFNTLKRKIKEVSIESKNMMLEIGTIEDKNKKFV